MRVNADGKREKPKVYIGGEEIPVENVVLAQGFANTFEALDNGQPGFRLGGLRDVQGTFEGKLDDGVIATWTPGPVEVSLWGPDPDLPWWKHWFYRLREATRGTAYPTVLFAQGPAIFRVNEEKEDNDDIVLSGTFTKAGKWFIKGEVNP